MSLPNSLRQPLAIDRRMVMWALALTAAGFGLRVAAADNELWLDEITTINIVNGVRSVTDIFLRVHRDNNHYLNSVYLYLIGTDHDPVVLRLMSISAGSLCIPAIGWAMVRGNGDKLAAAIAMAWMAVCYFPVHFGSEARGYGLEGLFCILAIIRIDAGLDSGRARIQLAAALFLGMLSHPAMALFGALVAVWLAVRQFLGGGSLTGAATYSLRAFLPAAFLGLLPVFDMALGIMSHTYRSDMPLDPLTDRLMAFGQFVAASLGLGGPANGLPGLIAGVSLLGLTLVLRRRLQPDRVALFGLVFVLFPAILLVCQMRELAPRYFMPVFPPLVMLVSEMAALGLRGRLASRVVTILLLTGCMTGNASSLSHFLEQGRGHYAEAIADMTAAGPGRYGLRVPFGVGSVVAFYAARMSRDVMQVPSDAWCMDPPLWFIRGSDPDNPFPPDLIDGPSPCRTRFRTFRIYRFWGLSGWEWTMYRKAGNAY